MNDPAQKTNPIAALQALEKHLSEQSEHGVERVHLSAQAVAALNAIGKPYSYVNIFEDQEIREGLKTYSNWPTFPQLYVKGELIGGCDIMIEMYHSGELKDVIEAA